MTVSGTILRNSKKKWLIDNTSLSMLQVSIIPTNLYLPSNNSSNDNMMIMTFVFGTRSYIKNKRLIFNIYIPQYITDIYCTNDRWWCWKTKFYLSGDQRTTRIKRNRFWQEMKLKQRKRNIIKYCTSFNPAHSTTSYWNC